MADTDTYVRFSEFSMMLPVSVMRRLLPVRFTFHERTGRSGGERNVRFLCRAQNTGHSFDLPSAFDHSQWKRGLYRMSDLGLFKTINSCAVKTIDYHLELDAPVQPARHFYGYHKTQELILPK